MYLNTYSVVFVVVYVGAFVVCSASHSSIDCFRGIRHVSDVSCRASIGLAISAVLSVLHGELLLMNCLELLIHSPLDLSTVPVWSAAVRT